MKDRIAGHVATLRRRADFLKSRPHASSWDAAERAALEWALVNLPANDREQDARATPAQADSSAAGERCPQCPHPSACQVHDECLKRSAGGQGDKP